MKNSNQCHKRAEKPIEKDIRKYLRSKGYYEIKIHGSEFMESGIPDIICCANGYFVGIEVKRTGAKNEQSLDQKIHEANIKKANGIYILADCLEDVKEIIDGDKYSICGK